MSIRTEKVASTIRETLGAYLSRYRPDYLDGMVTITAVRVSADLSTAKVYVSIFRSTTDPAILIKRMNTNAGEFRSEVAGVLRLRRTPELRFFRDETLDAAEQIDRLIDKVRAEDARVAALRGEGPEGSEEQGTTDSAEDASDDPADAGDA